MKKILIIQDSPLINMMLTSRLEVVGFSVMTAETGEEGLEMAKSEQPDLIILDLMLPKMDGYMICGLLESDIRYSKIPILMFTAKAQEEDVKLGQEVGANAYLSKPFEAQALLAKISELLIAS